MQTEVAAPNRRQPRPNPKSPAIAVGSRVTFAGTVLRVLAGTGRTLLIMVDANAVKLTIKDHWFANGAKLKASYPLMLCGTVTRVGEGPTSDHTAISVAVDGYPQSRVTVGAKWVTRVG